MALWGKTKAEKQNSAFLATMCYGVRLIGFGKVAEDLAKTSEVKIEVALRVLHKILNEAKEKGITADDYMFYVLTTNDPSRNPTVEMPCPNCRKSKNVSTETRIFRCPCGLEKAFKLTLKRPGLD